VRHVLSRVPRVRSCVRACGVYAPTCRRVQPAMLRSTKLGHSARIFARCTDAPTV
jgi:hypothetical protein